MKIIYIYSIIFIIAIILAVVIGISIKAKNKDNFNPFGLPPNMQVAYPNFVSNLKIGSNVKVKIVTGNDWFSGTDSDVYIIFANGKSFKLDKPNYNDFERGSATLYNIPDNTLTLKDVKSFSIKLESGTNGYIDDWKLDEVTILFNGLMTGWYKPEVWLTSGFTMVGPVTIYNNIWKSSKGKNLA